MSDHPGPSILLNDDNANPATPPPHLLDVKLLRQVIGNVVRSAREAKGWTQEDVGEQVGVTAEFYARVERGHVTPGMLTAARLADVLQLEFDELFGLKPLDTSKLTPDSTPRRFRKLARRIRQLNPKHLRLVHRLLDGIKAIRGCL